MLPLGLCIFLIVSLSATYNKRFLYDPDHIARTSLLEKIVFVWITMVMTRMNYYVGWLLTEGAAILSGFSFNGYNADGSAKWDRIRNVDILGVEFAQSLSSVVEEWNMGTAYWLKHYVYLRLSPKGARPSPIAFYAVYAVSALWHGFYPGYYLFFLCFGFAQSAGLVMRRAFRPFFMKKGPDGREVGDYPKKYLWDALGIIASAFMLNYLAASFTVLAFSYSITVFSSMFWIGHIIAIAVFLLGKFGVIKAASSHQSKPKQK